MIIFKKDNKVGILDESGKEIIPPVFDYIGAFNPRNFNMARVKFNKKDYYVQKEFFLQTLKNIAKVNHLK